MAGDSPMYPAVTIPSQSLPGNDSRHNKPDYRQGGGPTVRTRKKVPPSNRGGFGHQGQRVHIRARMGKGRGSAGNPGKTPSVPHVGRRAFPSETRVAGHGGSPQVRDNMDTVAGRGGFGQSGQGDLPSYGAANPQPGAGNLSGRMARRITSRFNNKSKQAGNNTGKYGGPPVRLDT